MNTKPVIFFLFVAVAVSLACAGSTKDIEPGGPPVTEIATFDETAAVEQATLGAGNAATATYAPVAASPPSGETALACSTSIKAGNDPSGHAAYIKMLTELKIQLDYDEMSDAITFTGSPPFIDVSGHFNPADWMLGATGMGEAAGYSKVAAAAYGTFALGDASLGGKLFAIFTYEVGGNGALPGGQSITYDFTCQEED